MQKQLSKRDVKELNEQLIEYYGESEELGTKSNVEELEDETGKRIAVEGQERYFLLDGKPVPLLRYLLDKPDLLKKVVVDMGAVRFVTSGADIMRPGITEFAEGLEKGETVAVVDENHGKPLAIGRMLMSGPEAETKDNGKIIENLHHVGDKLWTKEE